MFGWHLFCHHNRLKAGQQFSCNQIKVEALLHCLFVKLAPSEVNVKDTKYLDEQTCLNQAIWCPLPHLPFQLYPASPRFYINDSLSITTTKKRSKSWQFLSDPCAHGVRSLGRPVTPYIQHLFETLWRPSEESQCCQCCEDLANED